MLSLSLGHYTSVSCISAPQSKSPKTVLDKQGLSYTETEVAQVKLAHRPGELARAASRLGDANININYAYCGIDASTDAPLLIVGVKEVGKAVTILDQLTAAAA